jgi:hypothetical protein
MLLKRSGAERLKMGCSMYATARAIAKSQISEQHAGAHPAKLKRLLFLHFYGADFRPDARKRILSALSKKSRPREIMDAGKPTARKRSNFIDLAIVKSSGLGPVRKRGAKYGGKAKIKAKRPRRLSR